MKANFVVVREPSAPSPAVPTDGDPELSVELAEYVARASSSSEGEPEESVADAVDGDRPSDMPCAVEPAQWIESVPPPIVWLSSEDAQPGQSSRPLSEVLLEDFDGDGDRLKLALELLGKQSEESSSGPTDDFAAGALAWLGQAAAAPVRPGLAPDPAMLWQAPSVFQPERSDVDQLVADFTVGALRSPRDWCSYLADLAGLDRTPGPPPLRNTAAAPKELNARVGSESNGALPLRRFDPDPPGCSPADRANLDSAGCLTNAD